jgi:hypothetical protein
MRALMFVALAACTPDVVSGAYLCGPEATCPEGQTCNGTFDEDSNLLADTCVLSSVARPFVCTPKVNLEPDDTIEQGHLVENLGCVSAPFMNSDCMLDGDSADWVTFEAPSVCTAVAVEARLSFSIAYEELTIELWDFAQNVRLATDEACASGLDSGSIRRCLDFTLVPGTKYGIKVSPTGNTTCGGSCAYNRYTLSVQLATPG